jgi:tetratricopeptide (TPR) repeat protein
MKGDYEKSLFFLKKADNYYLPDSLSGRLFNTRGLVYLQKSEFDKALKDIKKAVKYSPDDPYYWENLGVTYGIKGNHKMAKSSFEKGLRLGSESVNLKKNLANAYILTNECQKAFKLIQRIKGIKPQGKPWTQNEKVYNPAASGRGIKNHNK